MMDGSSYARKGAGVGAGVHLSRCRLSRGEAEQSIALGVSTEIRDPGGVVELLTSEAVRGSQAPLAW